MTIEIDTERLRLRRWRDSDREPFAAMNMDPAVMEFFPAPGTRASSDATIDAWNAQFDERGWSNWAAELRATGEFIGFVGLSIPKRVLPFSPCVEVGWRLARAHWGHGYATEGARAVMERIGMRNTNRDFEHPGVPENNPLRPHCLYKITRDEWRGILGA